MGSFEGTTTCTGESVGLGSEFDTREATSRAERCIAMRCGALSWGEVSHVEVSGVERSRGAAPSGVEGRSVGTILGEISHPRQPGISVEIYLEQKPMFRSRERA